jgi:hypothetical protein
VLVYNSLKHTKCCCSCQQQLLGKPTAIFWNHFCVGRCQLVWVRYLCQALRKKWLWFSPRAWHRYLTQTSWYQQRSDCILWWRAVATVVAGSCSNMLYVSDYYISTHTIFTIFHSRLCYYVWVTPHCRRSSCAWQWCSLYLFSCVLPFCHGTELQ